MDAYRGVWGIHRPRNDYKHLGFGDRLYNRYGHVALLLLFGRALPRKTEEGKCRAARATGRGRLLRWKPVVSMWMLQLRPEAGGSSRERAFPCPQVTGIAAPGPYPLSAEGGPREPAGKSGTEVRGGKLAKLSWGFRLILRILFGRRFRWVKEHRAKRVLVKRVDSLCTTKFSI